MAVFYCCKMKEWKDFTVNFQKNTFRIAYNTINHNLIALFLSNISNMNTKFHLSPVLFISHALKNLAIKLTQNPEYYTIKHYSKMKRKHRQDQSSW